MTENVQNDEKIYGSITLKQGLIIFCSIILIGVILFGITQLVLLLATPKPVTNSDIDGDWNSTLTTYSFVFIPKCNINGLEFTFSIRDESNKELQKIVKKVGDVKKGQQYTVSFTAAEIKDFATLMNSDYTQISVTNGTKKLI